MALADITKSEAGFGVTHYGSGLASIGQHASVRTIERSGLQCTTDSSWTSRQVPKVVQGRGRECL
jgi:hypothetical protein